MFRLNEQKWIKIHTKAGGKSVISVINQFESRRVANLIMKRSIQRSHQCLLKSKSGILEI